MNGLNITEYQNEPGEYQMFYGRVSLGKGYYIENFDERFYHLVGVKGYSSFPELLHPEDVASFMEAVEKLKEGSQHLILRLICYNDKYRSFYVVLAYNDKVIDGFHSIDLEVNEIMTISRKFTEYNGLVEKYREFMSLFSGCFMEYEYDTDILKLYEYNNRQNKGVYQETLEAALKRVEWDERLSQEQKAEFQILYETLRKGRNHVKVALDAVTFHGREDKVRFEIMVSMIFRDDVRDRAIGLVSVISEQKPKQSYYLSDVAFDPGTGLLNKRAINEYAIEMIQNQTEGLHLVIIDVDDFKKINDNFGHMYGDTVLTKIAEILKGVVKTRGRIGRFGGDEFMIVLEGIDSETTLRRILTTIGKNIAWAFRDVEGLNVTTSIGVSQYPIDGVTYEELFRKADKSVYIAKAKGKNRYIIYDEKKHGSVEREDSNRVSIGFKAIASDDKKHEVVSDLILQLYREKKDALVSVMEQMQTYFDIDGIAVYAGENLERIFTSGKYVNPITSCDFVKDSVYQEFFDEQGFFEMSKYVLLENKAPRALDLYNKQETRQYLQCELVKDGEVVSVVSFDFFNRAPKLGTTDRGLIRTVGRMMAEVAAKG